MEAREPLDAKVAELDEQRAALAADVERHTTALGAAESEVIAEMQAERAARDELRVVHDLDLVGAQLAGELEGQQDALVLGDVVGRLAEVAAALGQLVAVGVGGDCRSGGGPGVPS
jgi:hypothetical protein